MGKALRVQLFVRPSLDDGYFPVPLAIIIDFDTHSAFDISVNIVLLLEDKGGVFLHFSFLKKRLTMCKFTS